MKKRNVKKDKVVAVISIILGILIWMRPDIAIALVAIYLIVSGILVLIE